MLSEVDHNGMNITEVAKRIQERGLRDLRTSKTPEASVAGALSRDVVFCRVKPSTYALQAIVAHHNRLVAAGRSTPAPDAAATAAGAAEANGSQQQPKHEGSGVEAGAGVGRGVQGEAFATPQQQQQQENGSGGLHSSSSTTPEDELKTGSNQKKGETAAGTAAAAVGGRANGLVRSKSGVEVVERNSPAVEGGAAVQNHDDEDVSDDGGESR